MKMLASSTLKNYNLRTDEIYFCLRHLIQGGVFQYSLCPHFVQTASMLPIVSVNKNKLNIQLLTNRKLKNCCSEI